MPEGTKGVDTNAYHGANDSEALAQADIEFVYAKATKDFTYANANPSVTRNESSGSSVTLVSIASSRLTLGCHTCLKLHCNGDKDLERPPHTAS